MDGLDVLLVTHPGFEDVVLAELGLPGQVAPDGRAGHVRVRIPGAPDAVRARVLGLRSIHRAVRPVAEIALPDDDPLGAIRAFAAAQRARIPELADPTTSFRVTGSRVGEHPFTSEDVARAAGAGIRDAAPHPVDLTGFDVHLRCEVVGRRCALGVQWTGKGHGHRRVGPYNQRTSLRSNAAWALCALAERDAPRAVLDPFVGAGTVLQEAGAMWPDALLAGGDLHQRAVDGATANLRAAGLGARCAIRRHDARRLDATWPDHRFDLVVTNPPFGRRMGRGLDLPRFYRAFLASADAVCTPDARMVVLAMKRGAFHRAVSRAPGWAVRHVRVVELGGLYVGAFVLGRPGG